MVVPEAEERAVDECVFCLIRDGRAEASVVYEDDLVLVFMNLRPVNPGHLLVVPRVHVPGLDGITDEVGARLWSVGRRAAQALRRGGVRCEGVNLVLSDGEAASQTVFHAHLHVIPRFFGDAFHLWHPGDRAPRADLDARAAELRPLLATDG